MPSRPSVPPWKWSCQPDNKRCFSHLLTVERLEDRVLPTVELLPLAHFAGTITVPGEQDLAVLPINAAHLTLPRGKVTVAFLEQPAGGSSFNPGSISLKTASGAAVPTLVKLARIGADPSSYTLARLKPGAYTAKVLGERGSTGAYTLDVFLAGDINQDGQVDATDLARITSLLRVRRGAVTYDALADVNRDGVINKSDRTLANANLGVLAPPPPAIAARLANDTGSSVTDGVTFDPALTGSLGGFLGGVRLRIGLDNVPPENFKDASADIRPDGTFALDHERLGQLLGSLSDGNHIFRIQALTPTGIVNQTDLPFLLDTTAPGAPALDLSPTSDTGDLGDRSTTAGLVTLVGQSTPLTLVNLVGTELAALPSQTGRVQFSGILLEEGANTLRFQTTDLAGNSSPVAEVVLTRTDDVSAQDPVLRWNQATLEAIRLDATAPPLASRALAMVHAAIFDAVAAIEGVPGFHVTLPQATDTSAAAAVGAAAHRVLTYLYPAQQTVLDVILAGALADIPDGTTEANGVALGQAIGDVVVALRQQDGWDDYVEYLPGTGPGEWQPTPPVYDVAQLPQWADLKPFAMTRPDQFQPDAPPALHSQEYADAVIEVQSLGRFDSSTRSADQTQLARFWADGKGTYTPPGHWNQIAAQFAQQERISLSASARLFAQLNVAMADAAIVSWNAKYAYELWRPVTAIRAADSDGNAQTTADESWASLIVTPNFPSYTSGHSTFSGAAEVVLSRFFGADVGFTTNSIGLAGVQRSFTSFRAAAEEAGKSRIYGGIHFEFDNQAGLASGRDLAVYVLDTFSTSADTRAPQILLDVAEGLTSSANLDVTGRVVDNLSGVSQLEVQLDAGSFVSVTFDASGRFQVPTGLALNGSADGSHLLNFRARDAAGNLSSLEAFSFTLDTRAPTIALDSPTVDEMLSADSRLTGTASGTGSALTALSYKWDDGQTVPISFAATTGEFDQLLSLNGLAIGSHTLTVRARDAAGNVSSATRTVQVDELPPFTINAVTPLPGASDVGSTFRPQVFFSRPVDSATLNADNFHATDSAGTRLDATIVPAADGSFAWLFFASPMPGASTITLHVDGSAIESTDGTLLDADGDGTPGGAYRSTFTTVSLAGVPGTTLTGIMADPGPDLKPGSIDDVRAGPDGTLMTADDVYLRPIAGVKVYILGLENAFAITGADGRFTLTDIPAGNVKLVTDGLTATNAPAGFYFPEMVMDLNVDVGRVNTVMAAMQPDTLRALDQTALGVYLPRLQESILQPISDTEPTRIGVDALSAPDLTPEQREYLSIEIQPGSLIGPDGQPLPDGRVGLTTVPPELVREMLPLGLMQLSATMTIQGPGIATFATPVKLTFPNVYGGAPGSKLNVYSFDHTTGRLVITGTATVSEDSKFVVSDPGSGINAPGWFGVTPPGVSAGEPGNDNDQNQDAPSDDEDLNDAPIPDTDIANQGSHEDGTPEDGGPQEGDDAPDQEPSRQLDYDFLRGREGRELDGYVPRHSSGEKAGQVIGKSGVTVGTGFDIGQHSRAEIDNFDIPQSLREKLYPYVSPLRKEAAATKLSENGGLHLTDPEVTALDLAVKNQKANTLARKFEAASGTSFNSLPPEAQTVLFSVYYQRGDLSRSAFSNDRNLWSKFVNRDYQGAVELLRNYGDEFPSRRRLEADYLNNVPNQRSGGGSTGPGVIQSPSSSVVPFSQRNGTGFAEVAVLAANQLLRQHGRYVITFFNLDRNQIETRTIVDGGRITSVPVFLAANTNYRIFALGLENRKIGYRDIRTPTGGSMGLGELVVTKRVGFDRDGDGLSNYEEFILGTDPSKWSTTSDGISDLTKVELGLDPLTSAVFPTAVIATLPLQGQAKSVVLSGSLLFPQSQTAYLATGSFGLAVVNASNFQTPLVLGQLDLAGDSTDVVVELALNIAVVASNAGGLQFVDVSDPARPQLLRTIPGPATQVEVLNGIAYAAVGSELHSYDLLTGERTQRLTFNGSDIVGLAREGFTLYSLDSSRVLRAIDISSPSMVVHDSLTLPVRGGLFVGGGIAYVGAGNGIQEGFATVDVANPDDLRLLSGVDSNGVGGVAVVPNGSGLAVAVGRPGQTNVFDVMDVRNPANTGAFVTRFSLPTAPFGVAIGAGIAFVADGSAGLQVVNYRAFDNLGVPPTVSSSLPPDADIDASAPGVQALQGSAIRVLPGVADDVQVRNVELLLNGQVVRNVVSFPFDLTTFLPTITQNGSTTVTLQVRATDTGGNVGLSTPISVELLPDTTPPTIINTNIPEGSTHSSRFRAITLRFSEALDPTTVTAVAFQLSGPQGSVQPIDIQLRTANRDVQLTYPSLVPGAYQFDIDAPAVTDAGGNALGDENVRSQFTIVESTAVWINPAGGFWDDVSNWEAGTLPASADDVLINVAGDATITYRSGSTEIRSLLSNNPLVLSGGNLRVTGTLQVNNTLTFRGGTLAEATVLRGTGGQGITFTNLGGTLDAVTVSGDLDLLSNNGAVAQARNGLTLNGATILLGNAAGSTFGVLSFDNTQTLGGSGTVLFGASGNNELLVASGAVLTLGPNVTIHGIAGKLDGGSLVNQGILRADVVGGSLTVNPFQVGATFTNQGLLAVNNGASLSVNGLTGNLESVELSGTGSQLHLSGSNYVTNLGLSTPAGTTATLNGSWSNPAGATITATDATLSLGDATPSASFFNVNLLANPGAEAGGGSASGNDILPVPGWTTQGNFTVVRYGATGGFARLTDPGPPDRGTQFFVGGPNNAVSSATQTIDVSSQAGALDVGGIPFTLSGYLGGFASQNDNAVVTATFKDAQGRVLGTNSIGPVLASGRSNQTGLVFRSTSGTVPTGTRSIVVTQLMTRTEGAYNDACADNLSLVIGSPTDASFAWSNSGTITTNSSTVSIRNLLPHSGTLTASPGSILHINGDFSQTAAGVVNVQIGGTGTSQFGRIQIVGSATLAGVLNVSLVNGFNPAVGDSFEIVTYASHVGTFDTVIGLDIEAGKSFTPVYNATNLSLVTGSPLQAAGIPAGDATQTALTAAQLQKVATAAITRILAASVSSQQLAALLNVQFVVANLEGNLLGLAGSNVILVDQDAAGFGWFVDDTPLEDEEFFTTFDNELQAEAEGRSFGRMDLLTVLMHELGHILGLEDLDPFEAQHDLMSEILAPGTRSLLELEDGQRRAAAIDAFFTSQNR